MLKTSTLIQTWNWTISSSVCFMMKQIIQTQA
uniref:Uncharacterized protein n=1 Tax=Arundo donax TaxID=35708 RepID=A0A0A9C9K3_ARUDO